MSYAKPRKRPCSVCRKWFLPDVRQAGRQKTCSPKCSRELHRRNCAKWNKKNTAYFKSNYLDKKLEKDSRSPPESMQSDVKADPKPGPKSRINLNLPRDIINNIIGGDNLIIIEYLTEQIFGRIRNNVTGIF
ncbi:MAG: hypothetical protein JRI72_12395 [Deltaproteobacteria bacterium]|nr:hypothetical protein [Deltaproteobacteria bacterium]